VDAVVEPSVVDEHVVQAIAPLVDEYVPVPQAVMVPLLE